MMFREMLCGIGSFCVAVIWLELTLVSAFGIQIEFDYSHDTDGFLDEPKRQLLEIAASHVNRYVDRFEAIIPSGDNRWFTLPPLPPVGVDTTLFDMEVPADTLKVIVGGNAILPLATISATNVTPSSFWDGTPEWEELLTSRGQPGALASPPTDYAPWGGVINFNSDEVNWHFGLTTEGLDEDETDFLTVAMHELMHVMGFGPADSFQALTDFDNLQFSGPRSLAEAGQDTLALNDGGHWADGTLSVVGGREQTTLMGAVIPSGARRYPTALDRAALLDVGWQPALAGDVNLDGQFNPLDILLMGQAGKYGSGEVASWAEGDWNDDLVFDRKDIVEALLIGHYLQGPYAAQSELVWSDRLAGAATLTVPEPAGGALLMVLISLVAMLRPRVTRAVVALDCQ